MQYYARVFLSCGDRGTYQKYGGNYGQDLGRKLRGIQELYSSDGFLMMIAMDQRGSLAKMLNPADPDSVSYKQMEEAKVDLSRILAPPCQ